MNIFYLDKCPKKVDEGKRKRYIFLLTEATMVEDHAGMKQLLDELRQDSEMKLAVWAELPRYVRLALRKVENP